MRGLHYAGITVFRLLKWVGGGAGLTAGCVLGFKWLGVLGSLIGGTVGFCAGIFLITVPEELGFSMIMRKIERSPITQLRAMIAEGEWNLFHTMALLQLAARGEDVQSDLPRVLAMLESESFRERMFGRDAFRLVYTELAEKTDYDPNEPAQVCREKIARLRATLAC